MSEDGARGEDPATVVAVLAGGLGARIGGAKAAVELGGRPLISYPLAAAREAGLDAVVVARDETELPPVEVRVLHDPFGPHHPLRGVVAALRHAPRVLAVGCDMPFLTPALLAWLAAQPGDALVTSVDGHVQPLPAIWSVAHVAALRDALAHERSMRATLQGLQARVLPESAIAGFGEPRRLLFSVNDAGDVDTARDWMGC